MMSRRSLLAGLPVDTGVVAGVIIVGAVSAMAAVTHVQLTGGYATGAIVAAMLTDRSRTAAVAGFSILAALAGGFWEDNAGSREWWTRISLCVILAGLAVLSAAIRDRREASLRRLTVIADAAQQAVLRSMPTAIGSVGFAARYVSASEDALVGGDLYEVAATPFGVRVIVGDVCGKGLEAVQTAASVLGAFRQAAFTESDLAGLARAIDDVISRLIGEEEFVTAILGEFRDEAVTLANCGHHPPLLIQNEDAHLLDTGEPTLPLGLGPQPTLVRLPWPPRSRLLFYTDGLVEARDRNGEFFPLHHFAPGLAVGPLEEVLDELLISLRVFGGKRVGDDVALVLAENRFGQLAIATQG